MEQLKIFPKAQDFLPINGTDYVEFFVLCTEQYFVFIRRIWFSVPCILGIRSRILLKTSYVLVQDKNKIGSNNSMSGNTEIEESILQSMEMV